MNKNIVLIVLHLFISSISLHAKDWLKVDGFQDTSIKTVGTKSVGSISLVSRHNRDVKIVSCEFKQLLTYDAVLFTSDLAGKRVQPFLEINGLISFSYVHNVDVRGCVILTLDDGVNQRRQLIPISVNVVMPPNKQAYAYTDNLEYDSLYSALRSRVINHTSLGYKSAREVMFGKADNINDTVECIYTGRKLRTVGIPPNGEFNTEHTWVQSRGSSSEPNKSDINHLYPTFPNANSIRANYPFGNVVTLWRDAGGGSRLGFTAKGDTVFEPRSISKGNVARSIFYYLVRYGNVTGYYNSPYNMDTPLREWNKLDPPDDRERRRADTITAYQGKRNPFVDFPIFVERMNFLGSAPTPYLGSILKEICASSIDSDTLLTVLYNGTNSSKRIKEITFSPSGVYDYVKFSDGTEMKSKGFQDLSITRLIPFNQVPALSYCVLQYDNGAIDSIAIRVCGTSSVSDIGDDPSFKFEVNPHPIDEDSEIRLELPATEIRRVALYTLEGRELADISDRVSSAISSSNANTLSSRISLSNLPSLSGVVIARIQTTSGVVSKVLVVK